MRYSYAAILMTFTLITGCSSSGSSGQTLTAMNIVRQADSAKVKQISIAELNHSFLNKSDSTNHQGKVVEISGTVSSFEMTNEQLYIVTIKDNESQAVCIFDSSIAPEVGEGRTIAHGATLTIQGQCFGSGLFSSTPFTLDGCRVTQ